MKEPVAIFAAITTAMTSTLALLIFMGVNEQLVGGLQLAMTGWIGVGAAYVRSKVTPVGTPDL